MAENRISLAKLEAWLIVGGCLPLFNAQKKANFQKWRTWQGEGTIANHSGLITE